MKSWDFRGRESHVTGCGFGLRNEWLMGVCSSSRRLALKSSDMVKELGWGSECCEGLLLWFRAMDEVRACDTCVLDI